MALRKNVWSLGMEREQLEQFITSCYLLLDASRL